MVGTRGISTAKDAVCTLKTISGVDFTGYNLLANYYVSWARAFPEHLAKIGRPQQGTLQVDSRCDEARAVNT